MNKRNQLKIWTDLSSLLPHTSIDLDNLRLDTKRYVDIVESLADEVKFDTFGKSRLMILPFHFDKELKKSKVKESDLPMVQLKIEKMLWNEHLKFNILNIELILNLIFTGVSHL